MLNTNNKIKPCPICGSEPKIRYILACPIIMCAPCHLIMYREDINKTQEELIARWNKRKTKPYESRKKLPCTCGRKMLSIWDGPDGKFVKCPKCDKRTEQYKTEIEAIRAWNKMISEESQ